MSLTFSHCNAAHPIGCAVLTIGISPSISPLVFEDIAIMASLGYEEILIKNHFCAKSENCGAICENKVSENRRTFADGNEKRVLRKLKNEFSISNLLNRDLTSAILGCTSAKQVSLIAFGLHEHCRLN